MSETASLNGRIEFSNTRIEFTPNPEPQRESRAPAARKLPRLVAFALLLFANAFRAAASKPRKSPKPRRSRRANQARRRAQLQRSAQRRHRAR